MDLTVIKFGTNNEAVIQMIPKLASCFTDLKSNTDEIQLIGEMQGINKKGLAIDKKKLKKKLITLAIKYSNKVAILAKGNSNNDLLTEIRFSESDLSRLAAVTLKDSVQLIFDRVEANLGNLADQGITPETQKTFLEAITEFNNAIASPRSGVVQKRNATQKLSVLFDKADSILETMDLLVASARDEYPDFFNGYKDSRKIIDTGSGTLALKATAKEFVNGVPLDGALFIFKHEVATASGSNGGTEIVKKTTKKGNFHVKSMEPGTYKVEVSKQGFKNKVVSVSITDGERSELVVELEKV